MLVGKILIKNEEEYTKAMDCTTKNGYAVSRDRVIRYTEHLSGLLFNDDMEISIWYDEPSFDHSDIEDWTEKILGTKMNETIEERTKTHGDYDEIANLSMSMYNSLNLDLKSEITQMCLFMILHKVARIVSGQESFVDHWHDIQGYAKLAEKHFGRGNV